MNLSTGGSSVSGHVGSTYVNLSTGSSVTGFVGSTYVNLSVPPGGTTTAAAVAVALLTDLFTL